jgi:uncharacterized protein YecE (DUF72 family)
MERIGISGWTYLPWRGVFYPKDLPRSSEAELSFASRQLDSIEINGSFYSLQRPESYEKWHRLTPENFIFSVKAPRYITHIRRLKEIEKPVANFMASGILRLREKLGPILWQFPPSMKYDGERFENFLALLPRDTEQASRIAKRHDPWMNGRSTMKTDRKRTVRHAIEVRHESFRTPEFVRQLKKHEVAFVCSHSSGAWPMFEEVSADFVYIRLHGDGALYSGGYGPRALREWSKRISAWTSPISGGRAGQKPRDAFVYFDNDVKVRAPFDAISLRKLLSSEEEIRKVA